MFYQVIRNRRIRQIGTGYRLYPEEWDSMEEKVVVPDGTDEERCLYLAALASRLEDDSKRMGDIIGRLERAEKPYTADKVVELFDSISAEGGSFLSFSRRLIARLKQMGKHRTADAYTTTLNSFVRFCNTRGDMLLDEVDADLMVEYESYLKSTGVCLNTTSYYMRNLRAMYNRAVEQELVAQQNPFRHVFTGIGKTVKRAVPLKVIRRIRNIDLSHDPKMDYARDLFMFSFYTRGMSFIDMAYLKKKDLQNGILSYRRQKTGQQLFIKWERPMQEIVDKYNTEGSPYLLPIIRKCGRERKQYINAAHLVNIKLKKMGKQMKLNIPLTTYVARHGWASIARSKNVPLSVISEAMGHDSENTTRIYLASLDTSMVDKANRLIMRAL